ncbi:hypothetical protein BW13_06415 [Bifidobacterium sp. UTCIF-37]|uniref:DUF3027 domain-containing protein n=1 Tax=Bifidobacterium callitrichos TaxID=762209 RepID=A0A2T3G9M9_9BIFI|nr:MULTISPECIES: DUF3027 domain-containing protein [Bifidobacterium]PST46177.1 hypothetical protein CPA40_06970 [Bifidobacterium callitrichos]TPF86120.1 hypothetical protein BW13_06415 [Bifidobacterium sp. UTCIF-37]TPF88518.1 hypothetical protein BW11_07860 [Bifidobacterium sp. UTCIF-38]
MTDTSEINITDDEEQDIASPQPRIDPRDLARAVAIEVAEEPEQVGDVVDAIDLGDGVTDFRIAAHIRGYEGWQWSVTLYHDEELDHWTVNESSLIPTSDALVPPAWIPWKDRLEPTDLAPTDSIGTDPDDPRLEEGFRRTDPVVSVDAADAVADADAAGTAEERPSKDGDGDGEGDGSDEQRETAVDSKEDVDEAVEEFDLSRRHVLSSLGRAQAAKRWYEGPRGPKAMSTKTADGNLCSTCGFFVPLKGELNLLFGVCANKWSPDDGRVVSLDHGCGEHSEIEPPEPSRLWVQSKPAFDDLHIDIIAQRPREDRAQIELLEAQDDDTEDVNDVDVNDADKAADAAVDTDVQDIADAQDIDENTEIDADSEDVEENTVPDDESEPEVESTVDLSGEPDIPGTADTADDADDEDESEEDDSEGSEKSDTEDGGDNTSDGFKDDDPDSVDNGDTVGDDDTVDAGGSEESEQVE